MIGPFFSRHTFCLNIGFWQSSFEWKWLFSILVASTKKRYSSCLKKVFLFQKICFKVKVLNTFETLIDCHKKRADLSNGGLFSKSPVLFFWRTNPLSVGFKMKTLRKSIFECQDNYQFNFCRKSYWKNQPFIFTTYLWITRFSDTCTIMVLKEINEKRQKQPTLYFNGFFE